MLTMLFPIRRVVKTLSYFSDSLSANLADFFVSASFFNLAWFKLVNAVSVPEKKAEQKIKMNKTISRGTNVGSMFCTNDIYELLGSSIKGDDHLPFNCILV